MMVAGERARAHDAIVQMDLEQAHSHMIEHHLKARGIVDERVLHAFRSVPREAFLRDDQLGLAYEDQPLPIGEQQTISQPYIVALTVASLGLTGRDRVLDIGTGSGYAAAILSRLAALVFTVERVPSLAASARERLARLGYSTVEVRLGDGTLGWPERGPFDAIAVAASAPRIPEALVSQLSLGGRLVIPIGSTESVQKLVRITRTSDGTRHEALCDVRFVPLIGEQGFDASPAGDSVTPR